MAIPAVLPIIRRTSDRRNPEGWEWWIVWSFLKSEENIGFEALRKNTDTERWAAAAAGAAAAKDGGTKFSRWRKTAQSKNLHVKIRKWNHFSRGKKTKGWGCMRMYRIENECRNLQTCLNISSNIDYYFSRGWWWWRFLHAIHQLLCFYWDCLFMPVRIYWHALFLNIFGGLRSSLKTFVINIRINN